MAESLIRIRSFASLLWPAGRGAARLLVERITTAPRRIYVGAGLAALLAGIGGNALLLQIGRHPAPLLAEASHDPRRPSSWSRRTRLRRRPRRLQPRRRSPRSPPRRRTPPMRFRPQPPPQAEPRATRASAPDTTSSLGPAERPDSGEQRAAAHELDQIGALLHGKPVDDQSRLVRRAQVALARLGYPVKANGVEDGATRRALRQLRARAWFGSDHGNQPGTRQATDRGGPSGRLTRRTTGSNASPASRIASAPESGDALIRRRIARR